MEHSGPSDLIAAMLIIIYRYPQQTCFMRESGSNKLEGRRENFSAANDALNEDSGENMAACVSLIS